MLGFMVDSRSDGYRIVLSSRSRISEKLFLEIIKDNYNLYSIVTASLTGTHNVNWKTWCVAKNLELLEEEQFMKKNQHDFYMKDMLKHLL